MTTLMSSEAINELIKAVDLATDPASGLVADSRMRLCKATIAVANEHHQLQDAILMKDVALDGAHRREAELQRQVEDLTKPPGE